MSLTTVERELASTIGMSVEICEIVKQQCPGILSQLSAVTADYQWQPIAGLSVAVKRSDVQPMLAALQPKLMVADEPVSMVDASLRMSIVNLFRDLRDRLGVSIIYITHDLSTAYYISDRVIIMHKGDVVEAGVAQEVLGNPQHAYSQALSQAVLPPDPEAARKIIMAKIT